jgi:hypothetical protein
MVCQPMHGMGVLVCVTHLTPNRALLFATTSHEERELQYSHTPLPPWDSRKGILAVDWVEEEPSYKV